MDLIEEKFKKKFNEEFFGVIGKINKDVVINVTTSIIGGMPIGMFETIDLPKGTAVILKYYNSKNGLFQIQVINKETTLKLPSEFIDF